MPTTVEEVQAVVRLANEHRVALWTHGTGRNNGYGGPAPRVRGSVIVSLRNGRCACFTHARAAQSGPSRAARAG